MTGFSQLVARCPSPAATRSARRFAEKRAGALITAIAVDGAFEGYASLFGLADQGGDVVMPGAFRQSVAERGTGGIKMLWQHDPATPIGVWDEIAEDGRGLFVAGRLDLNVAKARELYALMRSGAVDGLSIGFKTERARKDPATGQRRLFQIDLWEISLVTFPMLPQARVSAVKSATLSPAALAADRADDAEARAVIRAMRRAEAALRS